jgi:nitrogen-specific signal transduction histidine kinase
MMDSTGKFIGSEENISSPDDLAGYIKNLRLASIERITALVVHEINNPMQAIQGGAVLGLEEIDDPEAIKNYLSLIRREADRVLKLTAILRSIYHPDNTNRELLEPDTLIDELLILIKTDLSQKGISFIKQYGPKLLQIKGVKSNLQLAFLNLFLNLDNVIFSMHQNELSLSVYGRGDKLVVDLAVKFSIKVISGQTSGMGAKSYLDISLAEKIIRDQGGTTECSSENGNSLIRIELPNA